MDGRVRQTIFVCNQRLYLSFCCVNLKGRVRLTLTLTLSPQLNCLDLVFDSLIMSKLLYASSIVLVWLLKC